MLKLRQIDPDDYTVLEGDQRIGRIRYAKERSPGIWMWNVHVHVPGRLPELATASMQLRLNSKKRGVASRTGSVPSV